ncbi:hypothetical protein B5X24_HaOG216027 [Helicoverpa armigera]|nr:hypothetical protein B5X24_HaOG216027 [Helicoverpa armigera]
MSCTDLDLISDSDVDPITTDGAGSRSKLKLKTCIQNLPRSSEMLQDGAKQQITQEIPRTCSMQQIDIEKVQETTEIRPKVFIAGGGQLAGLASKLILSRMGTRFEEYRISSVIKTNVNTCELLKSTTHLEDNKENYLILCVGEYDTNPNSVLYDLVGTLKSLQNIKILVLNVVRNRYLNEGMLNNLLKNVCYHFNNCKFLEIPLSSYYNRKQYMVNVCHEINLVLDSEYYNKIFLKQRNKQIETLSKTSSSLPKKGTIPYYFSQKKCKISKNNVTQNKDRDLFFP